MSAQGRNRSPTRQRGTSSPPQAFAPFASTGSQDPAAGGSGRKEPSLGVHLPGSNANPRRTRSIHSALGSSVALRCQLILSAPNSQHQARPRTYTRSRSAVTIMASSQQSQVYNYIASIRTCSTSRFWNGPSSTRFREPFTR